MKVAVMDLVRVEMIVAAAKMAVKVVIQTLVVIAMLIVAAVILMMLVAVGATGAIPVRETTTSTS